ncbi:MAG: hypothetical protein JSV86_01300 [Gemmatimonadota bacterium]|nr:MAG: hypothetical protein JSV86_01300 [Gemmatimonadota bacterium]
MGLTEFLLVVVVGGGIIAVLVATFKGAAGDEGARAPGTAEGRKAELEERYQAALRSIEEIEADHDAGNLSDADHEELRQRYETEVAYLENELGAAGSALGEAGSEVAPREGAAAPDRSWVPAAVGWSAAAVTFVVLAWLVMSTALGPRAGDGSIPGQEMGSAPAGVPVAEVDMGRLAELEGLVSEDPQNLEALLELGHMYLQLQRYDELSFVTQVALNIDPNNPEALTHLGMLLFSMQHPEGVIPTFDRALAVEPDFPEALQFKGMVSFMRGDYATAVQSWEHYREVVPEEEVSPRIQAMLEAARANIGGDSAQ